MPLYLTQSILSKKGTEAIIKGARVHFTTF